VCGICSCSIMANRLSWAAWETSKPCSTFMTYLNTDHTCDSKNIQVILWYSQPVNQPANMSVFSNRGHCPLSACSPTMWLWDYRQGMEAMFLMTVLNCLIKPSNTTAGMFWITWHKGMIQNWPL
jgi:hypothetical protein